MNNEVLIDYASKKTRFFNFILDIIGFWILNIIHVFLFEDFINSITGNSLFKNVLYLSILYFLFNLIFEVLFSKTPGKFLTGTKVITFEEKRPSFKTLMIRNLCRLIPFDAFSFLILDNGWHDSISKTTVVNI